MLGQHAYHNAAKSIISNITSKTHGTLSQISGMIQSFIIATLFKGYKMSSVFLQRKSFMKISSYIYALVVVSFCFMLSACGGGSSSPGNSASTAYSLGQLPNGSTVYVSESSFTAAIGSTTTGTAGLVGGTAGTSYTLSFSVNPSGPIITSTPNPCVIVSGSGQTCQITFDPATASPGTYTVTVSYTLTPVGSSLASVKDSGGTPLPNTISFIVTGATPPGPAHCNPCVIFVTESSYTGNLESGNYGVVESNGIAGADALCQIASTTESGAPSGTYKAMIVDGINRVACTSANCSSATGTSENVNWVLSPNTSYTNIHQSILFTTESTGIYTFGSLQDFLSISGADAWTGLSTNWQTAATTCNLWSIGTAVSAGIIGKSLFTTSGLLHYSNISCSGTSMTTGLYCVQQ
jgi:Protein of unknown function (DUF1554)